jgi:FAD/FMN-containing dehydrogenase
MDGNATERTGRMSSTSAEEAIAEIERRLPEQLVKPGHPLYDRLRGVYFTGVDRRPAAVVRVRTPGEVSVVVQAVHQAGARLSVKGGGHGFAARGVVDGAVVLDLSPMKGMRVDPAKRVAQAEAGLTTGEYTRAAADHGLATGFGDSPDVGLAGITLAGGIGFLHRRFGLSLDSLLGAQVVTADGRILEVDDERHPELFWALRGGGGNFGVVTRLDLRLHSVERVHGGMLLSRATPAIVREALTFLQEAPDEVSGLLHLLRLPPAPMFPEELHGEVALGAFVVHSGDPGEGERWMNQLRRIAPPTQDFVEPTRYRALFEHDEKPPPPPLLRWRSGFLDTLSTDQIGGVFDALQSEHSAIMRSVQLRPLGGAVTRVGPEATAFGYRDAALLVGVGVMYEDPATAPGHGEWVRSTLAGARGGEPRGSYSGFVGEDDPEGAAEAWPSAHRARLRRVKELYDPDDVFRGNVEIPEGGNR